MTLLRETMGKAVKGLEADGVSIAMNVKEAGGQMLPHAYIQIFPRFQEDENAGTPLGAIFQHREDLQTEEYFQETAESMDSVTVDFETEKVEPHPDSQKFKEENSEPQEASSTDSASTESEGEKPTLDEEQQSRESEVDLTKRGESIQWQ